MATVSRTGRPRGVVLWRGHSRLDGAPIVAVATFESANRKTGPVVQTWILRQDVPPLAAAADGSDESVCGECPLRGRILFSRGTTRNAGRACYVNLAQAPGQVWRTWQASRYPDYAPSQHARLFSGRVLRMGAYGDPCAVPLEVWQGLVPLVRGWTGYTHQWDDSLFRGFRGLLMASVETIGEARQAARRGWRTFRSSLSGQPIAGEIVCLAVSRGVTCEKCRLCCGQALPSARSIVIQAHGAPTTLANYRRIVSVC